MICVSLGEGSLPVTPPFWLSPYVPNEQDAKISILTQVSPRLYSNEKRNMDAAIKNDALINKQSLSLRTFRTLRQNNILYLKRNVFTKSRDSLIAVTSFCKSNQKLQRNFTKKERARKNSKKYEQSQCRNIV